MAEANEVVARAGSMFGSVPSVHHDFVCNYCLGPVQVGYSYCFACNGLASVADRRLRGRVVPMTTALNPSPWYTWLQTYKGFNPERGTEVAALAHAYIRTHSVSVAALLGAEPSLVTVVPSKRGRSYGQQPLRRALARSTVFRPLLQETLRFIPGAQLGRREYDPSVFDRSGVDVDGHRVVLIEDTWVTGSTALSAAGKLLMLGAASVAVLSVARLVDGQFWPPEHPYRAHMNEPMRALTPEQWPR